ncbi:MAG: CE1 family esterase [Planctomycetota bacterium]|jgi:polyhydroxybutyrate depolymerase
MQVRASVYAVALVIAALSANGVYGQTDFYGDNDTRSDTRAGDPNDIVIDLGRGPVTVNVPASYDPGIPAPLVMALHPYGGNGFSVEYYFQFLLLAEEFGFLYVAPDATTRDEDNQTFWNATDACCDFYDTGVDDSSYLLALIEEIKNQLNVDDLQVYLIGHSNGGFMSHRMACDHAQTIAAIASLGGATFADPADCTPAQPVHVLVIQGTNDESIAYGGGNLCDVNPAWCQGSGPRIYPGAIQTARHWATYNGCSLQTATLPPIDLEGYISGDETTVTQYVDGCDVDGSAELWTIVGGYHSPILSDGFSRYVIEYFLAHPKEPPPPAPAVSQWGLLAMTLLVLTAATLALTRRRRAA